MKKLIQGIVEFRRGLTEESRDLFAKLALGQKPDALFIACSDSRVVPNLFASTNPGDVFVLRNVGNLVPPASDEHQELETAAGLEFAVTSLNVADIIVCGHSECGAMQALAQPIDVPSCSYFASWLQFGRASLRRVQDGFILNPKLSLANQISQANVLQQIEHIMSYPFVRERVEGKKLRLHGWWFDIAHADVYCYEPSANQFVLIDSQEAELILTRLG